MLAIAKGNMHFNHAVMIQRFALPRSASPVPEQ